MKRGIILIVLIAVGFFVYTEYFQVTDETTRDASGEVIEAGDVSALLSRVGDCIFSASAGIGEVVQEFKTVPCTELHDGEVVGKKTLTISTWPGDQGTDVWNEHTAFCVDDYESYTGLDFETSPHYVYSYTPDETAWNSGNKLVLCVAELINKELMGASIKG